MVQKWFDEPPKAVRGTIISTVSNHRLKRRSNHCCGARHASDRGVVTTSGRYKFCAQVGPPKILLEMFPPVWGFLSATKTGGCDFSSYVTSPQPLTLIFRYFFGNPTKPNSEALMSAQNLGLGRVGWGSRHPLRNPTTGSPKPVSLSF